MSCGSNNHKHNNNRNHNNNNIDNDDEDVEEEDQDQDQEGCEFDYDHDLAYYRDMVPASPLRETVRDSRRFDDLEDSFTVPDCFQPTTLGPSDAGEEEEDAGEAAPCPLPATEVIPAVPQYVPAHLTSFYPAPLNIIREADESNLSSAASSPVMPMTPQLPAHRARTMTGGSSAASYSSKTSTEFSYMPTSAFVDGLVCVTGCTVSDREKALETLRERFDDSNVIKATGDGSLLYVFFRSSEMTEHKALFVRRFLADCPSKCDFVTFAFTSEPCGFAPPKKMPRFHEIASTHTDRGVLTRMCPLEELEDLLSTEVLPHEPCDMNSSNLTAGDDLKNAFNREKSQKRRRSVTPSAASRSVMKRMRVTVRNFFSISPPSSTANSTASSATNSATNSATSSRTSSRTSTLRKRANTVF